MQEGHEGNVVKPGSSQPEPSWKFNPDTSDQQSSEPENQSPISNQARPTEPDNDFIVSWTASEFIAHEKSVGWYLLLMLGAAVLAAGIYFISHGDVVATGVVIIVAIAFGILGARRPRELNYSVDENGIQIGEKTYPYSGFRSFSIIQEEAVESIWFMPLKRFTPPLSIYFDPKDGERIVDVIAQMLPLENRQLDPVDRLMHKLRF